MIDAHLHLWDPRVRTYPWMGPDLDPIARPFGPDELRSAVAETDVTAAVVVQALSSFDESLELLDVAATEELVAGAVCWVDLTAPDVADRLAELRAHRGRVVGIRHQVQDEPDPDWLLRDDVLRGLGAVRDAGLTFDLLVGRREAEAAIEVARRLPDLRLVLDHAGKPAIRSAEWDTWVHWLPRLAAHENVSCKLSGLVTEASWHSWRTENVPAYVLEVLDRFGVDRSMFGSDWPVSLLAASYADVLDIITDCLVGLSETERADVLGDTARRVYSLADAR